jgi:hypothetical protein
MGDKQPECLFELHNRIVNVYTGLDLEVNGAILPTVEL